jgi:hypothetical protein
MLSPAATAAVLGDQDRTARAAESENLRAAEFATRSEGLAILTAVRPGIARSRKIGESPRDLAAWHADTAGGSP